MAFKENSDAEWVRKECCSVCPWGRKIRHQKTLDRLMEFISLQDAGCPLGRYELNRYEWIAVGAIRAEREKLNAPKPEDYGYQKVPIKSNS